jgi:hypothetical protein
LRVYRAKAKKRKTGESSSTPENLDPVDPNLAAPEDQREAAMDQPGENVEPSKQSEPPTTEEVDTQVGATDKAEDLNPPSPVHTLSPVKAAEDTVLSSP